MELCWAAGRTTPESVETMERIRQAAPPDLSGLGGELPTIIRRCLARDPNERFASTEELRREIARLRHTLPLVTCVAILGAGSASFCRGSRARPARGPR